MECSGHATREQRHADFSEATKSPLIEAKILVHQVGEGSNYTFSILTGEPTRVSHPFLPAFNPTGQPRAGQPGRQVRKEESFPGSETRLPVRQP